MHNHSCLGGIFVSTLDVLEAMLSLTVCVPVMYDDELLFLFSSNILRTSKIHRSSEKRHFLRSKKTHRHSGNYLVSGCFEPCQPQRIISGLKTYFNPSPSYSAYKLLNHKIPK